MLYKFRSKATGDVLMLGPQGDQFLRALGREPTARGILEPPAMATALGALQQAIEDDERAREAEAGRIGGAGEDDAAAQAAGRDAVSMRRRLWPMVEMIRRAQAADEPIVWGV